MLIDLHLRSRHDLLSLASYAISPAEDTLTIEVSMQPAAMPPTVLAVAPAKALRALQRSRPDLDAFAHTVAPAALAAHLRRWPAALAAVAESSQVFADLFAPAVVEEIFSSPVCHPSRNLLPQSAVYHAVAVCCYRMRFVCRFSRHWHVN